MLTTKIGPFFSKDAEPIRCVIVDDHEMLRYGVRRLLEESRDFTVVGEAGDAAEALKVTTNPRVSAAAAQVPKGLGKQAAE